MSKSKSNKVRNKLTKVNQIIKFLSHSLENKINKAILGASPDGVIRAIANAAMNLQQNSDVKLDPATPNLFSTYSRSFGILTVRKVSIENKRKHLTQKGGALPFLGPLLGSALLSIGSNFISRIFNCGKTVSNSQSNFVKQVLLVEGEYERLVSSNFGSSHLNYNLW